MSTFLQPKLEEILIEKLNKHPTVKLVTEHYFVGFQEFDNLIQIKLEHKEIHCSLIADIY